jgi:antigen 43
MPRGGPTLICYLRGTRIRSEHGDVAIEAIKTGDLVAVRRDGKDVFEPVVWVGQGSVDPSRHAYVEEAAPIRVKANAIAPGQPSRDLLLTPEHCLILDGFCVPAKLLVNGGSITSERNHSPYTFYHVELERHGALIAEGALAESYLDTGNRTLFGNGPDARQLHPRFVLNTNADRWTTDACAPLIRETADLARLWTRLAERSEALGLPVAQLQHETDADVRLVVDSQTVLPTTARDGRYVFVVPANASSVVLASRFGIPADRMIASLRDTRRLGLRVERIQIHNVSDDRILNADDPTLDSGWYPVERDNAGMWRWTDGAASLPWDVAASSTVVTVWAKTPDHYPAYQDPIRLFA